MLLYTSNVSHPMLMCSKKKRRSKRFSLMDIINEEQLKAAMAPKAEYSEEDTLRKHGFEKDVFITDTLQGQTFTAKSTDRHNTNSFVIKSTKKELYEQGITITDDGKVFDIKEDIVKEAQMMQSFTANNKRPKSLIEFVDFFEDEKNYFLVQRVHLFFV